MSLSSKQLIGLPVETKIGQHLGKVQEFTVDPLAQSITQYTVKHGNVVLGYGEEILIAASQVVSITNEKMVVDDLVITEQSPAQAPALS